MDILTAVMILVVGLTLGVGLAVVLFRSQQGDLRERLRKTEVEASELLRENRRLEKEEAVVETEKKSAEEKLILLDEAAKSLTDAFKALSSEALKSNNQSFLDLAKSSFAKIQESSKGDLEQRKQAIDQLVKPVKESLDKVDGNIRTIEKDREGAYKELRQEIKDLHQTQVNLRSETAKLVHALRTPSVRGQWGEVQLERAVEFAGMVEYCDFVQQESTTTEEGRIRPDLIVRLPNDRRIIVDAKTPLNAYLDALTLEDEESRRARIQDHARHVREHIRTLGSKAYWRQFDETPEFVVLFLPGEAFFSAALEEDAELIEFGANEKVILATPTTLIALLKAVAYGWQQEKMAKHATRVSELGKELYERLATLASHFSKLGGHLNRSVEAYNSAVRSTESRVLVTARKFKELGSGSDRDVEVLEPIERIGTPPQSEELVESDPMLPDSKVS